MDTLLERPGQTTRPGSPSVTRSAAKARDEAPDAKLTVQQAINETLGARTKELETQAAKLAADLETASKLVEKYEADAKEAPELRERVAKLEQASTKLQHELDEKTADRRHGRRQEGRRGPAKAQPLPLRRLLLRSLERAPGAGRRLPLHAAAPRQPDSEQPVAEPDRQHRISLSKGSQCMDRARI